MNISLELRNTKDVNQFYIIEKVTYAIDIIFNSTLFKYPDRLIWNVIYHSTEFRFTPIDQQINDQTVNLANLYPKNEWTDELESLLIIKTIVCFQTANKCCFLLC